MVTFGKNEGHMYIFCVKTFVYGFEDFKALKIWIAVVGLAYNIGL
jgi:hypothetical protein